MTCHAQAAELLQSLVKPGDDLLDVGCGTGYFFHSLRKRNIPVNYFGIDSTPRFITIAKKYLPEFGLHPNNLSNLRIEDMRADVDHVICINVLTNIDNYHKPLERILLAAHKSVILRESCDDNSSYRYVRDNYLDNNIALNVHINTYSLSDISSFIKNYGFNVEVIVDERTKNMGENVIGYPHYWKFLVCKRNQF
jgi:ubiquinone/menaquinone biosynthesis C-methylase UbiE